MFLDEKKPCPLCPEEKFKACYGHKLHRHLQNLHWKISVEFEGKGSHISVVNTRRSSGCVGHYSVFCLVKFLLT